MPSAGPFNRATVRYFHRFPCRSRFLRTLARSRVGSFDKMLDAAAALGFATAMDVSGVNIVGIEQQRDFARRGQLRWPRASALVEWHDGNIHTTNFPPAKSAVRYARWSNSPCAAASWDSTSPTKGEHSTRRALAPRYRTLGGDGRSSLQSRSLMRGFSWCVRRATDRSPVRAPPFFAAGRAMGLDRGGVDRQSHAVLAAVDQGFEGGPPPPTFGPAIEAIVDGQ